MDVLHAQCCRLAQKNSLITAKASINNSVTLRENIPPMGAREFLIFLFNSSDQVADDPDWQIGNMVTYDLFTVDEISRTLKNDSSNE